MLDKKDYDELKKEILEFIPSKIIDSHVHTGTSCGKIDLLKKEPHPLSYSLLNERMLKIKKNIFDSVFPFVSFVGFPLPLPFKETDPLMWNNKLMIEEMKGGLFGLMHWVNDIDEMGKSLRLAKKEGVKFRGIKFHPRLVPNKEKKTVLLSDFISDDLLEFVNKEKLAMLLELSHGICDEDTKILKKIDNSYDINVVVPHMGNNHKGFVMGFDDYWKSLSSKCFEFEKDFLKLKDCDKLYFDTSMIIDRRPIEAGLKVFGEDRIMYGSDFPFCFTPKIKEYRPAEEEVRKVLIDIVDCKKVVDKWKYDYNVYLMVKAIINAGKNLNMDLANKTMYSNAVKAYRLK